MGTRDMDANHQAVKLRYKMKLIKAMVLSLFLLALTSHCLSQVTSAQNSQTINITRRGSQQSSKGSAQSFTGSARIEPVFDAHDPSRSHRRQGDVRARRPDSMAHPPTRPDTDHHGRYRLDSAMGSPDRRDPRR